MNTHTMNAVVGRLAPSPTGLLHLGNAWAFLLAWLACRKKKGRLILRFEDIDPARSREEYASAILTDLAWLGLDWDDGPYVQSERLALYEEALNTLAPHLYPCFCTRKELKLLASAPNGDSEIPVYPGTCRQLSSAEREAFLACGRHASLRFACPDAPITVVDQIYGAQTFVPRDFGGDFAVRRSDGVIAYQLATAVDDALMGVTQVVRGRDILRSTCKQMLLQTFLKLPCPTEYVHFPLLLDREGERFAKRHKSLALRTLRDSGVSAAELVGFLGKLAGIHPSGEPCTPQDLLPAFSYARIPREDLRLS